LLDEEGVSLRLAVDGAREIGADRLAEQRRELRARPLRVEALEEQARREPLAVPVEQRLRQRVRAVQLDLPVRRDEQHALLAQRAQEMAEKLEGGAVGP